MIQLLPVADIDAVGFALLAVTTTLSEALHPLEPVTVTVYVVVISGFTVMLKVVAPVLHTIGPFAVAVRMADGFVQFTVTSGPALTVGGRVFPVTTLVAEDVQSVFKSVTVTVYVPAKLTVVVLEVAVLLHK